MVCVDGLVCCLCFGRKLPVVGSTRMFLGFCFWRFYVIRLLLYQTLYFILEWIFLNYQQFISLFDFQIVINYIIHKFTKLYVES